MLISVLFFLAVLYLLVMNLLETALLETKMSSNYAQQIDNFYTTEQTLAIRTKNFKGQSAFKCKKN